MSRILLVDDERDIIDLISIHLQREDHQVFAVGNGLRAVPAAIQHEPDLIVLDLMLPGLDGISVFKALRAEPKTRHIPVIMLTARAMTGDRIAGLETGADDYLTKPFSPRELLLRIQAVLRRSQKVTTVSELRLGPFHLDKKNLALYINGQTLELTLTEYKIVALLMDNPNVLHSRGELLSSVWGYNDDTNTRTLDTHIKRLREKLGPFGEAIQTVRGQGYQFVLPESPAP
jgi:two-component system phosphate regulon response regulator PhoB